MTDRKSLLAKIKALLAKTISCRQTTKTSPARRKSSAYFSCSRFWLVPDALSSNILRHPATVSASCCNAGF